MSCERIQDLYKGLSAVELGFDHARGQGGLFSWSTFFIKLSVGMIEMLTDLEWWNRAIVMS